MKRLTGIQLWWIWVAGVCAIILWNKDWNSPKSQVETKDRSGSPVTIPSFDHTKESPITIGKSEEITLNGSYFTIPNPPIRGVENIISLNGFPNEKGEFQQRLFVFIWDNLTVTTRYRPIVSQSNEFYIISLKE